MGLDITITSGATPPNLFPSPDLPVIGGYVLLGANMRSSSTSTSSPVTSDPVASTMMCAGMGICQYSATPFYNVINPDTGAINTGTAVTFRLVQSNEFTANHQLVMTFNLSALNTNQPDQYLTFYNIMMGRTADGTPVQPIYTFGGAPYALADPNFKYLGIPNDTTIYIPTNSFDVDITGDVVTIWLTLADSAGNPW